MKYSPFILLFSVLLSGCGPGSYYIKENLSQGQVVDTAVVRRPGGEKVWGMVQQYDEVLEGYVCGVLADIAGKPVDGVVVKVKDAEGRDEPLFGSGVTDESGNYKIKFAIPFHWRKVDFSGVLTFNSGWEAVGRKHAFRIYLDQRNGILSYLHENAITVRNPEAEKMASEAEAAAQKALNDSKKKKDDLFGGLDFDK